MVSRTTTHPEYDTKKDTDMKLTGIDNDMTLDID